MHVLFDQINFYVSTNEKGEKIGAGKWILSVGTILL